uniref:Uncharacterized protein LOC104233825 n=1 Tax=Nicotiana sylvestris TaxID=4096 RepID=A0A1U7X7B9_NICSY|nr:PREDICTED: uncharacterized protein LOC104233825 [Nicotiana sylvestris]
MSADAFMKAHVEDIKVATRKSDVFKIKQRDDEMLREFVSRFQMEKMELPPVSDDWAVQDFMQGLNEKSSISSRQLKQNLIEYRVVTWSDAHNRYQSKIRVEDDQLEAPSGSVHPNRFAAKPPKVTDRGSRFNKGRYQLRSGSVGAPKLSEYNFSVDASGIVSAIGKVRDTRWPKPIQTDPSQRNPNLICKYHGTHGHRTEDCRQVREKVARLFNERYLRELLNDQAKNHFRERDANRKNEPEEP